MYIYSDGICPAPNTDTCPAPNTNTYAAPDTNTYAAPAKKKQIKPNATPATPVVDDPDHIILEGGGNPNKIGSVYQSFCGLQVFDFDEKFKVFVINKQQVVKIEFTDSIAYFSLPDTSGTIKFNANTPYFRIYNDGKKEYGKYLTNETLIVTKENNMKFGEKDLKPEEVMQITIILNNTQEPASSSWSTYALPVAAAATAAAGLAYLYKKSKRKPKKSKSTRRQSSSSSSSSRRPVKSSRKRKH